LRGLHVAARMLVRQATAGLPKEMHPVSVSLIRLHSQRVESVPQRLAQLLRRPVLDAKT
jgi:hypothetical protein